MRIAGIQLHPGQDVERNISRAAEMAVVAAEKGAAVIGFPELCLTPWFPRQELEGHFGLARPLADAAISTFLALSLKHHWDNLFPEGTRILALKGAEIVFAPTAASQDKQLHWERAITANAFANNLFVFRVNRVGHDDGITFYGRSFCADPWGELVSELAGSREAIVLADVDLKERAAADETWGFLRHRRPGQYGDLVK
jgi:predicted amidohydrolase